MALLILMLRNLRELAEGERNRNPSAMTAPGGSGRLDETHDNIPPADSVSAVVEQQPGPGRGASGVPAALVPNAGSWLRARCMKPSEKCGSAIRQVFVGILLALARWEQTRKHQKVQPITDL